MDLDVERFAIDLETPLSTADGEIGEREGFVVRLSDDGPSDRDDGDASGVGVGEATPLPGWTESVDRCRRALERAAELTADEGPATALEALSADRGERTPTPAARHGLALALADRCAKREDEPLYRYLGGGERVEDVPVNATVGDGSPEAVRESVTRAVEAGFGCVKVKVGARDPDADRARIAAARDAAGPEVSLRADANGAWDLVTARGAVEWLGAHGVEYVEQPLGADDLSGHATLRAGPVGIALDETLRERTVAEVLEAGAADVVICKPTVLGGPDRARLAAKRARSGGADAVVTTTIDGVVARTGAVHVAASLSSPPPCGLATADLLAEDLAPDPAPVRDGRIAVPQASGHGVDLAGQTRSQ